jgi:hypothetical protein
MMTDNPTDRGYKECQASQICNTITYARNTVQQISIDFHATN